MVISERGTMGEFNVGQHLVPRNLTVVIWDNGIYQITGKQPTATAGSTDIVAVAKGAGIPNSYWVHDEQHFEELTVRRFSEDGPLLLAAKIDDKPGPIQTPRDPVLIRNRFMKGLFAWAGFRQAAVSYHREERKSVV